MTKTFKLLPYYISKKWLTKNPPKGRKEKKYLESYPYPSHSNFKLPPGWEKGRNKIIAKCHKNTHNYCDEGDRKKVGDCVKGMAGTLMVSVIMD